MIRVVVAEDQVMVREAFAALLGLEADIEVVATAADGYEALRAVDQFGPDVVLTDIEMPAMTGLELAHRLAGRVKVVIVTTFARAGYLRRALEAGVHGYILKDAPIDTLVAALRTVHGGGRVIDPELAIAAWGPEDPLTDRERDVLRQVGDGRPNAEIAGELGLAEGTVRNYLSSAMLKLDARNRTEAFAKARDRGIL